MKIGNITYKCKVDGVLGKVGKYSAICGKIKCGDDSICGAHGNKKCEHKVRLVVVSAAKFL